MSQALRVLVVDDSALMRKLIPQLLGRDGSIEVVGTAMDGEFALDKIADLKPHVITLDLEMPRKDGLETLREIVRSHKLPVIVVSSHSTDGASVTLRALAMGAFDFVAKPQAKLADEMERVAGELIYKIKTAAASANLHNTVLPAERTAFRAAGAGRGRGVKKPAAIKASPTAIVAIGVSTGGPNALQQMLPQLPADFPGTILVVQHMPEGFTAMFARRLNESCTVRVKEAQSGDLLQAGRVLICPGNRHMRVRRMPLGMVVALSDEERVNGHRPSVDVLFHSVAQEAGPKTVAVLMTGMGEDGAEGLGAIKRAGGVTIAQSAESCVVFGMPRAAIERGHVQRVLPLDQLACTLHAHCAAPRVAPATRLKAALETT